MKSLTIVTTWGTKYWPNPVQPGIKSTVKNWPSHAKILLYPDDMSQQMKLPRTTYYDLCKEQPVLKEFINRNKSNQRLTSGTFQPTQYKFEYDAIRFSYKVFACIDAYQKTKPDMLWFLDADIITFEKIPMSWLEHITPDSTFTSYLGRPKKGFSETGYYAFNTAHKYADEFFKRWEQYYAEDLFFNLAGYTDSFTFDAVRIEMEKAGKIQNEDLNDGRWTKPDATVEQRSRWRRSRHPFINSELGQYMDHLKGYHRKTQLTSRKRDLTTKQTHPYWKTLKD
ncbi:MAG: hypothetical protein H8D84_00835 [Proteobacteria bacterium]|jgi:hypothetical protein|nr:hypothetical protein [Pseudomonadota bacterium]